MALVCRSCGKGRSDMKSGGGGREGKGREGGGGGGGGKGARLLRRWNIGSETNCPEK